MRRLIYLFSFIFLFSLPDLHAVESQQASSHAEQEEIQNFKNLKTANTVNPVIDEWSTGTGGSSPFD
ncbi:MAG: hypothetical protein ACD_16C00034G0003 [uncultured bacterium]|nr:MAG: hypothetical protein ACD_16C00034G0003 [uncultured bacterium]OFW68242.1 MAG: hypothetical protein A2X70_06350 [Alphaproteobacteria bacterium GWC2_42_16]OFW74733.1 MAG: hypothetical protein A2Z80_02620 [Alphaproteobacteria bacterium GWA2_41_27]OFW85035.1 MAG: hypothetical protein A3E50_05545 [Alphaproteobacteria bacterium RIFCSPHIGHO2_12_FULL_42_100]OFW85650.1 MAG: hypothetical protein A2W06_01770 [Alphaproteobacteria bacterium RBG_16_42_14]OFW92491.1 MAG: hypothetical protein A2W46_023